MDLQLKLKSIDIDIWYITKICELGDNEYPRLNRLKELKEEVLNIRNLLGEIDTPKMTDTPVIDEVVFKNLFFNIINDGRFSLKRDDNQIYLASKMISKLLRDKNIDRKKFFEFLRSNKIITTLTNTSGHSIQGKVYTCILININAMNRLV